MHRWKHPRLFPLRMAVMILASNVLYPANGLENGLARTPPMGWNTFNCFGGSWTPYSMRSVARAMVANGMKECGYIYCNFDGSNEGTDPYFPDKAGFVAFAKPIADSVHAVGLKCGCYSASLEKPTTAVSNLVMAGMDFIKLDAWTTPMSNPGWAAMRDALLAAGRPILFSIHSSSRSNAKDIANMWRQSGDIGASWSSQLDCIHTVTNGTGLPGGWPDPDMLQIGNMNPPDENAEMAFFSLWCVVSAPLIAGCDPRVLTPWTRYILLNTEAIAVNQDTAFSVNSWPGGSGRLMRSTGGLEVWYKSLSGNARAVVLLNTTTAPASISVTWTSLGLSAGVAQVRDLWEHANLGSFTDQYSATVPAQGCKFIKVVPGTDPIPVPTQTWPSKPPVWTPESNAALDRTGWTISTSLTFTYSSASISVLLDGDVNTRWFSNPSFPNPGAPAWVLIDMKGQKTFNRIILDDEKLGAVTPRPYEVYNNDNTYEIMVSDDNTQWRGPVATGAWPYRWVNRFSTVINFPDQTARYIKIVWKAAGANVDQSMTAFARGYDEIYVVNVPGGSLTYAKPLTIYAESAAGQQGRLSIVDRNSCLIAPHAGMRIIDVAGRALAWHRLRGAAPKAMVLREISGR